MKYNKFPSIKIEEGKDSCWVGANDVFDKLKETNKPVITFDCYQGVLLEDLESELRKAFPLADIFDSKSCMKTEEEIREMTYPDVTDDRVFGVITELEMLDFFNEDLLKTTREKINTSTNQVIVFGVGAQLLSPSDSLLVYADMARWEIQLRMRKNLVDNIGIKDREESIEKQYKRAYFVDWRVCDTYKRELFSKWDYVLDSNNPDQLKLATAQVVFKGLEKAVNQPFSVVPYFDSGVWGGHWMQERFGLDPDAPNFAWSFNCVPEENSLLLEFGDVKFEIPSIDLVFLKPEELLGPSVYNRFGAEFPIRFDFLDTMGGGNLSLQVHPLKEYIKESFNMDYTQDESYYMLDAGEDAVVYLGMNDEVDPDEMIQALKKAESGEEAFDADRFSKKWPAKKHDHFLIPAGTVHCSGKDSMVLEISATPYIFTFKLWDWGRLGMDGRPRPISIDHGKQVIQYDRTPDWTQKNLINRFDTIQEGEGFKEERTGLHELEFIETRRLWFEDAVENDTENNLEVLMLVEGDSAIIESPSGVFDPFPINYAEAVVIPAQLGAYRIVAGKKGEMHGVLKAYVR